MNKTKNEKIAFVLSVILVILIFSFPMQYIWNNILVDKIRVENITYWDTVFINFFLYFVSRIVKV